MGRTKLNITSVSGARSDIVSAKDYVSSAKTAFSRTKNSVDNKIKNRSNIGGRLNSVQTQLNAIDSKIARIRNVVDFGVAEFNSVENRVARDGKQKTNAKGINIVQGASSGLFKLFDRDYETEGSVFQKLNIKDYVAKFSNEKSSHYFDVEEVELKTEGKSSGDFKKFEEALEDKFKDKGWREERGDDPTYYNKKGKKINDRKAPDFYDKKGSVFEVDVSSKKSTQAYNGTVKIGENGKIKAKVGEAEVHGSISGGMYVIGDDNKKIFSPGVNAAIGGSITALEVEWDQQWLGDENFGVNSEVKATAGKVAAEVEGGFQVFNENGKPDIQLGVKASAEAIGGEVEGKLAANVLGGEIGVKGSVNYGVGAHADVGYRDGVFKCDIGVSIGLGVSLGFEVDVGGMVNTVTDGAKAAWNGIKDGWKNLWD